MQRPGNLNGLDHWALGAYGDNMFEKGFQKARGGFRKARGHGREMASRGARMARRAMPGGQDDERRRRRRRKRKLRRGFKKKMQKRPIAKLERKLAKLESKRRCGWYCKWRKRWIRRQIETSRPEVAADEMMPVVPSSDAVAAINAISNTPPGLAKTPPGLAKKMIETGAAAPPKNPAAEIAKAKAKAGVGFGGYSGFGGLFSGWGYF